ncbi:MAG TPA: hypothetical protein VK550_18100 [Polyangiaceae bacterium]|nr:hypothetical protein [Polyangiaceae bacterium]
MQNQDFSLRAFPRFATLALVGSMGFGLTHCSTSDTVATRGTSPTKTTTTATTTAGDTGGTGGSGGSGGSAATGGGGGGGSGGGGGGAGGAGGAAGTNSGGSGGTTFPPVRDATPDIGFDWPEGTTGKNPCKPGVYQGNFACSYSPGDAGVGLFPVAGPISLKMVQSQNGEFLEVREGLLDGTANLFFTFRADITGKLDCKTQKFDGKLEHGTYSGFLVINGTFQGPLASDYDRIASQFSNGNWSLIVDMGNGGCNGTWSAAYQGPAD